MEKENINLAFRMMLSLPFLPLNVVRRGFYLIIQSTQNLDDKIKSK